MSIFPKKLIKGKDNFTTFHMKSYNNSDEVINGQIKYKVIMPNGEIDEFNLNRIEQIEGKSELNEYDNFIKESNKVFSKKEEFFLEKLKSELSFVIKTIKEQYKYSSLDNKLYEEKIYINKHDNKTFMGIVDKIMYKTINDRTVVSIVDYKTGNPMISLDNVTYGIGMQLPIYLYLVSKSNKFKNFF